MKLKADYVSELKGLLPHHEQEPFFASYAKNPYGAIRANTLKISRSKLAELLQMPLEPTPFCSEGLFYPKTLPLGKSPFHAAGLFYVQEPSAMAVIPHLRISPGELVLDLCAAPGGKTTQIAAALKGRGLLLANEYSSLRVKALGENLERLGVSNCILCNENPRKLVLHFPNTFDKVLVDAPCSGQGMFRKEPKMHEDYSKEKSARLVPIQKELLMQGFAMLRGGGLLVYSTCTFAERENEGVVEDFLKANKTATLLTLNRLYPHKIRGEGHFLALIKKETGPHVPPLETVSCAKEENLKPFRTFMTTTLKTPLPKDTPLVLRGDLLYAYPERILKLAGLKVLRVGVPLGLLRKDHFLPSHAYSHALLGSHFRSTISLARSDKQVMDFLEGQTLRVTLPPGWCLVTLEGYPLGLGKVVGTTLKNHYPKGLRRTEKQSGS